MTSGGCVDKGFGIRVVGFRGGRESDDIFEDFVEVSGEVVSAWVNIDGGVKSFDVEGFLDASFDPIVLRSENSDVFLTEVVLVVACVLKHSRFIVA